MAAVERLGEDAWERSRAIRLRALWDTPDAFGSTLAGEVDQDEAWWRARVANPDAVTFVARDARGDVGLVVGAKHHLHAGDAGLFSMWAAPEARGEGVAEALVEAVVAWARGGGFRRLVLDVADQNQRAVRFYARLGFEPTGRLSTLPPPREHIAEHERARVL